jgi:CheY-like chemotaxis protein
MSAVTDTSTEAPRRILVVDDDVDIRETVAEILRDEGYPVDAVADGLEALDYLRTRPSPRLVLLDLMMPGMNGEDLVKVLRGTPTLAETRIAVVSAARDLRERAEEMKAVAFLQKPITLDRLLALVERHV